MPCLSSEQLQKIRHGLGRQVNLVKYLVIRVMMCVILFEVQATTQFCKWVLFFTRLSDLVGVLEWRGLQSAL